MLQLPFETVIDRNGGGMEVRLKEQEPTQRNVAVYTRFPEKHRKSFVPRATVKEEILLTYEGEKTGKLNI